MKTAHKIWVGLLVVVKIGIIIALVFLATTLIELKQDLNTQINQTQTQLSEQIIDGQRQSQSQINDLRDSLLSTKTDLTSQLNELKADTSNDFSGIIQEVIPSVVSVGTDISQGSGFIIDEQGYIITNAHVLEGGRYAKVLLYDESRWEPAELVGYNTQMDIAILKIKGTHPALDFADSDDLNVGEKAIAIGNPLGLSFSVTEGIISATERTGQNNLPVYLQIDTPLNSGNSGGPLLNKKGEVIGVANFKISNSESLGFALESNTAAETINNIFEFTNESVRV